MKKFINYFIFIICTIATAHAQTWNKKIIQKNNADTSAVYRWEDYDRYHSAYGEFALLKSGRFIYKSQRPIDFEELSEGTFTINKDTLILNSDIQADNIQIKVDYIDSTDTNSTYRRLSYLRNLDDTILRTAFYRLNNDTTTRGDYYAHFPLSWYPKNFLSNISSLKVELGPGFGSPWIPILPNDKFMKVTVLCHKDFNHYQPKVLTNYKFVIIRDKLVDISREL